jgi:hypothetical protein
MISGLGGFKDRILVGCRPVREGIAKVAPGGIVAGHKQLPVFVHLGAERLVLCG